MSKIPQPDPMRMAMASARAILAMAKFEEASVKSPKFGSDGDRRRARRHVREAERRVADLEARASH